MRRASWPFVTALAVLLHCLGPTPVSAQNFAFAELDDATLRARVETLRGETGPLQGAMDADVVVLARTVLLDLKRFDADRTENRIHLVRRDGPRTPHRVRIPVDPAQIGRVRGWILRADGDVERTSDFGGLDGDASVDPTTPVVLTYDDLRAGDAWGWSVISTVPFGVEHRLEPLSTELPVLRTRVHVRSGAEVTYWAEGLHTDAVDFSSQIRENRDGQPSWVQIDVSDVPARQRAIFSEPMLVREPFVRITRRARFYPALGTRLMNNDWDQWAALEIGSPTDWLEDTDEIRFLALDVGTRGTSLEEQVDLLFTWLEETIRLRRDTVPSPLFENADRVLDLDVFALTDAVEDFQGPESMSGWRVPIEWETNQMTGDPRLGRSVRSEPVRAAHDVLEAGEATPLERAVLFASMVRAIGIDVVIGFARDTRLGPLDFDATGRWQFTDVVVAPLTPDFAITRWYCPTRAGLAPGGLDEGLWSNSIVFVDPTIEEKLASLWEQVWKQEGKDAERVIPRYVERIRRERLTRILRTPSAPPRETHRLVEVVRFAPSENVARARVEHDAAFGDGDYWAKRFPDTDITIDEGAMLPVALDLTLDRPSDATHWALDGPTLFGRNPLDAWEGPDRPAFYVARPLEYRWSVEVPLPPSWDGAVAFAPVNLDHDALQYRAWVVTGDDTLVLERQLVLHAGRWDGADLTAIDAVVTGMLDFERGEIVLERPTDSR